MLRLLAYQFHDWVMYRLGRKLQSLPIALVEIVLSLGAISAAAEPLGQPQMALCTPAYQLIRPGPAKRFSRCGCQYCSSLTYLLLRKSGINKDSDVSPGTSTLLR